MSIGSKDNLTTTDLYHLNQRIKQIWDSNVAVRASDLEQATDYSYINIIKPWVIKKVICQTKPESNIMDIGCGCGYLTNAIYENGRQKIRGVDISLSSVDYAQKKYPNITFLCQDICEVEINQSFDLCLAVMVLNNIPQIEKFFSATRKLLHPSGRIIVVIPHPCFWPNYHLCNDEYSYSKEKIYEYQFATKGRSDYKSQVLYFHRKTETYLRYARQSGFKLTDYQELAEGQGFKDPDILCLEFAL